MRDEEGYSVLHFLGSALFYDMSDISQTLLERGADVNAHDKDLGTPLM